MTWICGKGNESAGRSGILYPDSFVVRSFFDINGFAWGQRVSGFLYRPPRQLLCAGIAVPAVSGHIVGISRQRGTLLKYCLIYRVDIAAVVKVGSITPAILSGAVIGQPLFRSRIFNVVNSIEGVTCVRGILLDYQGISWPWISHAVKAPAGQYFDIEQGGLWLNGKESDSG